MNKTYRIFEQSYPQVIDLIAKLNQRARKLHQPEITVNLLKSEMVNRPDDPHGFNGYKTQVHTVEISGETPGIEGWQFIASLTHEETGNIIRGHGEELPSYYRTADNDCDHCGMNRNRKQTYVLYSETEGYKQVGSTCLKDFTGYADIHAVASFAEDWHELIDALNDDEFNDPEKFGASSCWIDATIYMSYVMQTCKDAPFISKTNARLQERLSTSEIAAEMMDDRKWIPSQENIDTARKIIDWAQEFFSGKKLDTTKIDDYIWNCSIVVFKTDLKERDLGLFASIYSVYLREMGRKIENERKAKENPTEWLGQEGGKLVDIKTVVTFTKDWESQWGTTYLYTFIDERGNNLTWFASGNQYLKVGDCVIIEKATVKKHDQFNGEKQTVITRAKLVQLEK